MTGLRKEDCTDNCTVVQSAVQLVRRREVTEQKFSLSHSHDLSLAVTHVESISSVHSLLSVLEVSQGKYGPGASAQVVIIPSGRGHGL